MKSHIRKTGQFKPEKLSKCYKKIRKTTVFTVVLELLGRFELPTSSLPRMRSTY